MCPSLYGSRQTSPRRSCLSMRLFLAIAWACLTLSAAAQEAPLKPDVRLVIDVSGSMKRNDPENLRQPAVDLLVRLVPEGAKAGVWTFGKFVNMLVPHQVVDAAWREGASRKAGEINSVGLFTHIGSALETAAHDLSKGNPGYATSVILLTDGVVDISKNPAENEAEWRRIVDKVLPELKGAGYKVYAVALSDEADKNLLEKLALATDGTFAVAKTADDLMKIFLQAFDQAVPAQKVPLVNNRFLVDSSVNEFTALIFRQNSAEQTRLIGPDEVVIQADKFPEDVRWLRTDNYDLITIDQPYEGEWQVEAAIEPESRVTVVSNLSLRVKTLPNNVFRGARESISFALLEDGKPLLDKAFLGLLTNTVTLAQGNDAIVMSPVWSATLPREQVPSDGVFSQELPQFDRLGLYELRLTLDGGTFKREFSHQITVREPFSAALEAMPDEQGVMQQMLTVRSHSDLIDPQQTQIAATVVNPARRRFVKPLILTKQDQWQTPVPMDLPGDYQITIQVTGTDTKKEPFDYSLTPMTHTHAADPVFAEPDPEPEPEPEVVPPEPEPKPPEPEPLPEPTPEPTVEAERAFPAWLLYLMLAVGNLAILGGGYWLFRKLTAEAGDDAAEVEEPESVTAPPQPMDREEDLLTMDSAGGDEEEPPMEDLDPDEPPAGGAGIPELDDPVEQGEPTIEDLQDELIEQVMGDGSTASKEDFASEIRRAQGLDLEEDEMDEAISTLIDELDGKPRPSDDEPADMDDFDFGDDTKT